MAKGRSGSSATVSPLPSSARHTPRGFMDTYARSPKPSTVNSATPSSSAGTPPPPRKCHPKSGTRSLRYRENTDRLRSSG